MTRYRTTLRNWNLPVQYDLSALTAIVDQINAEWSKHATKSDAALRAAFNHCRQSASNGTPPEQLLVSVYALIKEACVRCLGLTPFDVQLTAAISLFNRNMVEMQTGEGKTLAAVFPAILSAAGGEHCHILTFNDYLARRDAEWMGPVYDFFQVKTGWIGEGMSVRQKKAAYSCEITYATAKAVGFDLLRSSIAFHPEEIIIPDFHFAIVDEADAVMIDEARNPLVLAGDRIDHLVDFYQVAEIIAALTPTEDFIVEEQERNVYFTDKGLATLEHALQISPLQAEEHQALNAALYLALHARAFLHRDVDYIIQNQEIKLVDTFTGRVVADRRWRNGLQSAVEAKEGLPIRKEGSILNSITLQHLLQKYPKLAGMTATASAAAEEFHDFYGLTTVVIPPHRPNLRIDHPDAIFRTRIEKEEAVVREIIQVHASRRPILVGTLTVAESEQLAKRLERHNLSCRVLNARADAEEAGIIAQAGRLNAITIATNMAGRGTDIILGGDDPAEKATVSALGGLYVIATNRHESRRIDLQLRGRAARQGDPGSTRFFISMEDDLMIRYKLQELIPKKYTRTKTPKPLPLEKMRKFIDTTQRVIEYQLYDVRKMLFKYASLIEQQRQIVYRERQALFQDINHLQDWINRQEWESITMEAQQKLRLLLLNHYDQEWAQHLEYLSSIRDTIHLVRWGGQDPLFEYRKKADAHFQQLFVRLEKAMEKAVQQYIIHKEVPLESLVIDRPTSTWTYIMNDNPFKDQLSILLLDSGKIGFQADPISALFLFIVGIWRKRKKFMKH